MRVGGQTPARVATLINCHPCLTKVLRLDQCTALGIQYDNARAKYNNMIG